MSVVDASLQRHLDWLYGPGGVYSTAGAGPCRCEHGWQSLGQLYGVAMGKGWVRTTTHPHCPHHGTKAEADGRRRINAKRNSHLRSVPADPEGVHRGPE